MTGTKRRRTWTGLVLSGASYENRRAGDLNQSALGDSPQLGPHQRITNMSVMKTPKTHNLKTRPQLPTQGT